MMAVVCWTRDTWPILELDAYKRAYEVEHGHEVYDVDHFELRCSPTFWRWMMALPTMAAARDALIDEGPASPRVCASRKFTTS